MNKIYGEYYPKKYLQNPIRDFHNNLLSHFIGETHVARVILLFKTLVSFRNQCSTFAVMFRLTMTLIIKVY